MTNRDCIVIFVAIYPVWVVCVCVWFVQTQLKRDSIIYRKVVNGVNEFWELLKESVILQGILAISFAGAVLYLAVTGQPIPEILSNVLALIIGFYFGSKVENARARKAR